MASSSYNNRKNSSNRHPLRSTYADNLIAAACGYRDNILTLAITIYSPKNCFAGTRIARKIHASGTVITMLPKKSLERDGRTQWDGNMWMRRYSIARFVIQDLKRRRCRQSVSTDHPETDLRLFFDDVFNSSTSLSVGGGQLEIDITCGASTLHR
jgi:hypothetical protein